MYGEWDVNALIPDATFCADASIDEVGIVFFATGGEVANESPRFRFPCADVFFDSGEERLLAAGTCEYQWRAYSGGVPLLYSLHYPVTVVPGVTAVGFQY